MALIARHIVTIGRIADAPIGALAHADKSHRGQHGDATLQAAALATCGNVYGKVRVAIVS